MKTHLATVALLLLVLVATQARLISDQVLPEKNSGWLAQKYLDFPLKNSVF